MKRKIILKRIIKKIENLICYLHKWYTLIINGTHSLKSSESKYNN